MTGSDEQITYTIYITEGLQVTLWLMKTSNDVMTLLLSVANWNMLNKDLSS